jgi:hypothetical protein
MCARCLRVFFGEETMYKTSGGRDRTYPCILVCRSPSAVSVLNELSFDDPMCPYRTG